MLRTLSFIAFLLSAAIPVQAQNSQPLIDVAPGVYAFGQQATSLAVVTETGVVVMNMYEDWFPQNAMRIVISLGMGH